MDHWVLQKGFQFNCLTCILAANNLISFPAFLLIGIRYQLCVLRIFGEYLEMAMTVIGSVTDTTRFDLTRISYICPDKLTSTWSEKSLIRDSYKVYKDWPLMTLLWPLTQLVKKSCKCYFYTKSSAITTKFVQKNHWSRLMCNVYELNSNDLMWPLTPFDPKSWKCYT